MDLIAVRPHGGEGLDRDVLQKEGGRVSGPERTPELPLQHSGTAPGTSAQARPEGQRSRLLCPVRAPSKHLGSV